MHDILEWKFLQQPMAQIVQCPIVDSSQFSGLYCCRVEFMPTLLSTLHMYAALDECQNVLFNNFVPTLRFVALGAYQPGVATDKASSIVLSLCCLLVWVLGQSHLQRYTPKTPRINTSKFDKKSATYNPFNSDLSSAPGGATLEKDIASSSASNPIRYRNPQWHRGIPKGRGEFSVAYRNPQWPRGNLNRLQESSMVEHEVFTAPHSPSSWDRRLTHVQEGKSSSTVYIQRCFR